MDRIAGMRSSSWPVSLFASLLLTAQPGLAQPGVFREKHGGPIGVISAPRLYGMGWEESERQPELTPSGIVLWAAPDGSRALGSISEPRQLRSMEYDYELDGALVYARQEQEWFQVETERGQRAWVSAEDAGRFVSFEDLLGGGLTAIGQGWNRQLHDAPESAERREFDPDSFRPLEGYVEVVPPEPHIISMDVIEMNVRTPGGKVEQRLALETRSSAPPGTSFVVRSLPEDDADELAQFTASNATLVVKTLLRWGSCQGEDCRGLSYRILALETRGDDWVKVALREFPPYNGHRGWLRVDADEFLPLARIQDDDRLQEARDFVYGETRWPIDIIIDEMRWVGGRLWLRINLMDGNVCDIDNENLKRLDRGWVPAHSDQGDLWVGFYSRGC